jgi:hypothetical protein
MEFKDSYFNVKDWPERKSNLSHCPEPYCGGFTRTVRGRPLEDEMAWWLQLQCTSCLTFFEGEFPASIIDNYERQGDEKMEQLAGQYRELEQSRMTDEIEVFARAIQANRIVPDDF